MVRYEEIVNEALTLVAAVALTLALARSSAEELVFGEPPGGYRLLGFDGPERLLARPVGHIPLPGETWAWDVARNGDLGRGNNPLYRWKP